MRIGYPRVSTTEQNLDLQRDALKRAACEKIIEDTASRSVISSALVRHWCISIRPGRFVVAIWQVIVEEHGSLVWRLANRLLGNVHDAADCYQTVFVEAFEASQRQSIENWPGFLTRLVTRRAIDLLRARNRGRNRVEVGPLRQQAQSPAADSPERIAQGRESIERLHEALTRLPADQVQVFCLRYFEQMSNQEIAALLTTNANRVGVLLQRARDFLREAIDALPTRDS